MKIEDLGDTEGVEEESGLTALIDADTIVYAVAVTNEYTEELLPREFYTDKEWEEIEKDPGYDEVNQIVWQQDLPSALTSAINTILEIQRLTETSKVELHFSEGKGFRHKLFDGYKSNRKDTRYPVALKELKKLLLEQYEGKIHTEYEADDYVVKMKRDNPDDYVLCAVDKDVLKAVKGKHFNYYRAERFDIDMKWQTTSYVDAIRFPYIQTLMGDSTDGIGGCPGIGPKKAQSAIDDLIEPKELWDKVCSVYKSKGLGEEDALLTMRLVNMNQLQDDGTIKLWEAPNDNAE